MRPVLSIARVAAIVAGGAIVAGCTTTGSGSSGTAYTVDSHGRAAVVKDPFNLCWRTGYWSPTSAIAECDPELAPKPKPAAPPPPPPAPAPPPPPPAPAPAPVAPPVVAPPPPPPPKPAAAPKPPPRCNATVTLQSDELFAFNSAALSNAARARLDRDVIAKIGTCAVLESVAIEGHTDRIGSQSYNQKLSEGRAAAVKQYLVSKGVPADKIETIGMGKTAPAKFCPDTRNQKELIECLAPNRRVSVDIRGPAK